MWQELGIEPTTELASIKRAYAARLKLTRPDQDAAGFARLRAAYEAALARVAGQQQAPAPRTEPVQPSPNMAGPSPADRPAPAPATSPQPRDRHEEAVLIALQSRDVPAAADALERALKAGTLPIGTEMRLSGFMLQLLTRRPEIPLSQLIEVATRFGWSGGVPSTDPAVHVLRSRIAAESWFTELSESARAPSRILGAPRAGAAALLLGKGKFLFSRMFPPQPPLLSLMSELYVHAPWIRGRFDAERIAQVEALVGSLAVTAAKGQSYISNKRSPFFFPASTLALVGGVATSHPGCARNGFKRWLYFGMLWFYMGICQAAAMAAPKCRHCCKRMHGRADDFRAASVTW